MTHSTLLKAYALSLKNCQQLLIRHPSVSMAYHLRELASLAETYDEQDIYGEGKLIEELEKDVATLLNKPEALFLPSGTMAQPIALRIWSEHYKTPWFAMHPTCHIELHELKGYQSVHNLKSVLIGAPDKPITLSDMQQVTDPVSSMVVELPMREIGGQLPDWNDLVTQSQYAKEKGFGLHMDGARLWQCESYYQRSLPEIADLFDSIYVSLYKDLGGISGSFLLGPKWFIDSARVWSRRCGGNLYSFYPYLLSAKIGIENNLYQLPKARECALWVAEQFNMNALFSTVPQIPQTNMFHLTITGNPQQIIENAITWNQKTGIGILPMPRVISIDSCTFELNFGRNVLNHPKKWWNEKLDEFITMMSH